MSPLKSGVMRAWWLATSMVRSLVRKNPAAQRVDSTNQTATSAAMG